jgi:hypothetical protein
MVRGTNSLKISYEAITGKLAAFVQTCGNASGAYRLTPRAEVTPYARCFAVFVRYLMRDPTLSSESEMLSLAITRDIQAARSQPGVDIKGKPYRQLLTFSLSALAALPDVSPRLLDELVAEQLPISSACDLEQPGCLNGRPGSGNQAMFMAIFLLHGRDYLRADTQAQIDTWVEMHIQAMNGLGFWGGGTAMTHLQFQNGYHQHEVLEYLGVNNPYVEHTLSAIREMADVEGHFAPYPGGGGCYDYDAVFMLTPEGRMPDTITHKLLMRTAASIVAEQGPDGGFAESIRVRPRNLAGLRMFFFHVLNAFGNWPLFAERMRYGLTLQRPKNDRIHTHWSCYSRAWGESNLWDSWFRMLALARIDVALNPYRARCWGFIDYPGIGYHPSLKYRKVGR